MGLLTRRCEDGSALNASLVEAILRDEDRAWGAFRFHTSVGSTSDDVRDALEAGADDYSVSVADAQTAGRGRAGHTWFSPPSSGLWFSLGFRPALPVADWARLTLVTGLAVAKALERATGLHVRLKWPNDLVVSPEDGPPLKLGGILCELVQAAGRPACVVGAGINVTTPADAFPEELRGAATSLRGAGGRIDSRTALLGLLLTALRDALEDFVARGGELDLPAIESRLVGLHSPVEAGVWIDDMLVQVRRGVLVGLDASGLPRLRFEDGTIATTDATTMRIGIGQE